MTKQQLNVRISTITRRQIDDLTARTNATAGEIVTMAVDRMSREERPPMEPMYSRGTILRNRESGNLYVVCTTVQTEGEDVVILAQQTNADGQPLGPDQHGTFQLCASEVTEEYEVLVEGNITN